MEKELKKAIKSIMKYDFYDAHEKPIEINLKENKTEELLKKVFIDLIMAIEFIRDDEDEELRRVEDDELAAKLGDDVVALFKDLTTTKKEEVKKKERKTKKEKVVVEENIPKSIVEEVKIEEKVEKKVRKRKEKIKEEGGKEIKEETVKFEDKNKRGYKLKAFEELIAAGTYTRDQIIKIYCEKFNVKVVTVQTMLRDAKNPKYNRLSQLAKETDKIFHF